MNSINQRRTDAMILRSIGFLIALSSVFVRAFDTTLSGNAFFYFDTQVAAIVAIAFAVSLTLTIIKTVKEGGKGDSPTFSSPIHAAVVSLAVADAVLFWSFTSWTVIPEGFLFTPSNLMMHAFMPVIAVIDWLLFVPHGKFRFIFTPFSVSYPALYYIFAIVLSSSGYVFGAGTFGEFYREVTYPYYFLQQDIMGGVGMVILVLLGFVAAFYAFSVLLYLIDGFMGTNEGKRPPKFYDPRKERKKRK